MLRRGCRFFLIGAACAAFTSCAQTAPAPPVAEAKPLSPVLPRSPSADDAARYLAGLPGRAESPFKALEPEERWTAHAAAFDAAWERWRSVQRPPVDEFQRTELTGSAPVFYPFGGPDVLNLLAFFPGREEYLMVGLEPPGSIGFSKLTPHNAHENLASVRTTLESVLERSFFITRQMDHQLRGQVTDGVLAVMLVQLVREGYTVLGATPVTLDGSGAIVPREIKERAPGIPGVVNPGVAIEFARDGGRPQRIVYLTVNLADKRLALNEPFRRHLAARSNLTTFFKSTSYLPHQNSFSEIRSLVLAHSTAVVQDDSGIPFHWFDGAKWQVQLYGEYDRPYGSFRYMQQKDLAAAYHESGAAKKLGFRIGYGYSKQPSNLQVARKKGNG